MSPILGLKRLLLRVTHTPSAVADAEAVAAQIVADVMLIGTERMHN
jgi:hypothetical protein